MKKTDFKVFTALHLLLLFYSLSSVLSKIAAALPFMSLRWCVCYAGMIVILGVYAIGWQQILKRLPLTVAFANKAVTVVWGLVWGALFFREAVTPGKLLGAVLVIAGVILFERADGEAAESETDHG